MVDGSAPPDYLRCQNDGGTVISGVIDLKTHDLFLTPMLTPALLTECDELFSMVRREHQRPCGEWPDRYQN
jgi:hypothetical protein